MPVAPLLILLRVLLGVLLRLLRMLSWPFVQADRLIIRALTYLSRKGGPLERTEQALRRAGQSLGRVAAETAIASYGPMRNSAYKARLALRALRRPRLPIQVATYAAPALASTPLHIALPRPHPLRNANDVHAQEIEAQGFSQRLAVVITKYFGTMTALYVLIGWQIGWMTLATLGIAPFNHDPYPFVFCLFLSNLIQLWALPALATGQNVLSRKAEVQSDEGFKATVNTLHDAEQMSAHLAAQDTELLRQTALLVQLVSALVPSATPGAVESASSAAEPVSALVAAKARKKEA